MIFLENVGFAYPGSGRVLSGVRFAAPAGSLVALCGANGSGKSTLMCLLAGLYVPDAGRVEVAGASAPGAEGRIREKARLVVQDADAMILGATVEEDLYLGRESDAAFRGRAESLARAMDLGGAMDRAVHTLSHGQKRKLCLASALADEPEVLLLDEPFSGLDYPGKLELRRILARNRGRGLTQVVAVHDLDPLADLADALAVMSGGEMALSGPPADVLDHVRGHGVRPPCSWSLNRSLESWEA